MPSPVFYCFLSALLPGSQCCDICLSLHLSGCFPTRMRNVPVIDYSDARKIIDLIVEKAAQMQKSVVVAVSDPHGELIAFARMDGAPISSIRIAANKAYTAARERKTTKEIGEKVRHPEKGHDIAYYGDPRFVGWGGGLPIWKDGAVAGAVAVSGLSSREDVELATLALDLIGTDKIGAQGINAQKTGAEKIS
jgi:glc operon protein GlcG